MVSIHHSFSYNPVSRKKNRMSSILTFLNRSRKLFTLKNCSLIRVKSLHSMRMCLMVWGIWHVKHCGCCSCFSMKESKSCMTNAQPRYNDLFSFLKAGLHSPKVGWIWKSLLWMLLFQCCCHFSWRNLLILGFNSVYGILNLSGIISKADLTDLAAESTFSFPLTLMWLGIQHRDISLQFGIESNLLNSLIIREFSSFYDLMIVRQKATLRIW